MDPKTSLDSRNSQKLKGPHSAERPYLPQTIQHRLSQRHVGEAYLTPEGSPEGL